MTDDDIYEVYLTYGYDAVMDFYEFKHRLLRGEIPEFANISRD